MPCNASTPRCEIAGDYKYDLPECCRAHTRKLVFDVGDALTAAGVTWWLDYGSLLGAVRNPRLGIPPGIIPHDKDADLGFLAEDWDKVLALVSDWTPVRGALARYERRGHGLGFQWIYKLPKLPVRRQGQFNFNTGDSIKVRLSEVNHSNVDLFPWYNHRHLESPNGLRQRRHYVGVDRNKGREFPEDKLLPLATIEWEGRMLPCPSGVYMPGRHTDSWFMEHRYLKTWMKPVRANNEGIRVG